MADADRDPNVGGPRIQGLHKGEGLDRRHGDPDLGGLSSGEKAAITRAERYGDELKFTDDPQKAQAAEQFRQQGMGQASRENADARADDPLSNPKNRKAQGA